MKRISFSIFMHPSEYCCQESMVEGDDLWTFAYLTSFRNVELGDESTRIAMKYGTLENGIKYFREHVPSCDPCGQIHNEYRSELIESLNESILSALEDIIDDGSLVYAPDQTATKKEELLIGLPEWYKDTKKD